MPDPHPDVPWIETEATVTTCRFQSPALSAMAFGVPLGKRFRITFDYYAHGRLYSGSFGSDRAIPQNETVPVRYNPFAPEQNSLSQNAPPAAPGRGSLMLFGVAGSVVLSLGWLLVLRGCR